MNYDSPYVESNLSGVGIVPVVAPVAAKITLATIVTLVQKLAPFIKKLVSFIHNDNGIIAARDKIFTDYVRQITNPNPEPIIQYLYSTYKLTHDDIPNTKIGDDYTPELTRLVKAVADYIAVHAGDSSPVLKRTVDPQKTLDAFSYYLQQGMNVDHAFWMAFTGKKDPFDLYTTQAQTLFTQQAEAIKNAQAGFFASPSNIAISMVGGTLALAAISYFVKQRNN